MYDKAISGCQQRNLEKTWRAISELINSLNMDAGAISWRLLAIYEYCTDLARNGQYDEVIRILKDLRDTWAALQGVKATGNNVRPASHILG